MPIVCKGIYKDVSQGLDTFGDRDAYGRRGAGDVGESQVSSIRRGGSSERRFITDLVRRQTKRGCVFNAGPKQLLVWGQYSGADVQEISSRVS